MNWQQFQAILWLRWRLTRNQFFRGGAVTAVVSIFMTLLLALGGAAIGIGGVAGGWFAGAQAAPEILLIIWDAVLFVFLIFWMGGLLIELQRSESIDLTKLLHLPVTLRQVFVLNYAVSHFTPSIVLLAPGMVGFCLGLTLSGGPILALTLPLTLSFLFLLTSWTYCLRGWLAALMVNKRRRRAIMVWITLTVVLIGQLPNLVFNSPWFRHWTKSSATPHAAREQSQPGTGIVLPELLLQAHMVVPLGWVGYGTYSLKQQQPWPALAATAAGGLLGALGILRAYRLTLGFYQGVGGGTPSKANLAAPAVAGKSVAAPAGVQPSPATRGILFLERRLPLLPDDTAALTLATFRSLLRAPEMKMVFVMPIVMGVVLASMQLSHVNRGALNDLVSRLAGAGAVIFSALSMAPTMANMFGADRDGFRALVLLPTRRHQILLAKNLAYFPFMATVALALLTILGLFTGLSWDGLVAGILQVPMAFLMFSLSSNVLAILAPYRLAPGSLNAKKPKAIVFFAAMGSLAVLPVVLLPVLVPVILQTIFHFAHWLPWLPVNLLTTVVLFPVVVVLYWQLLPLEGRLLERRELAILKAVTEEVE